MGNYQALPIEVESVSNVTLANSVDLGTVRLFNGEEYVYVYNAGGASITAGYGVIASGTSGYSVTVSSVTGVGAFMGFCKHATIVTAGYGWILTKGVLTNAKDSGSGVTAGAAVCPGANGSVQESTGALSAAVVGFVFGATGAAGSPSLFVRCYGS